MGTKFELDAEQQARLDAWFKHHWDVVHVGFQPRDMSGFCLQYVFGPTGMGCNIDVQCVWCAQDNPCRVVCLTTDFDEGKFIYEYDANWHRLPTSWEKK